MIQINSSRTVEGELLPVVTHHDGKQTVAWRCGRPVSRDQMLQHVYQVADLLPNRGGHVINACIDRYNFCVAFLAALISDRTSVFPPAYHAEAIRQVAAAVDTAVMLDDNGSLSVESVAGMRMPELTVNTVDRTIDVPLVAADHHGALVFTSGSTGQPEPHLKTWGRLVANTHGAVKQLSTHYQLGDSVCVLGTVPAQHMYGFESTILLPLQHGGAIACDKVFFPSEVIGGLRELPHPRVLVTTPYHLRNLLQAQPEPVKADLIICATAPLDTETAEQAERLFAAPLIEIYGSTETGQIATRRTTRDDLWQLFDGITLSSRERLFWARGGHIEQEVTLGDQLELVDEQRFRLLGRNNDLVNIAGKRSSLAYLDRQLLAIDGVLDGAFHMPDDAGSMPRLAAFVVAPELSAKDILAELRQRLDPVFLPRPLLKLDQLPRNASGKLPHRTRCELMATMLPGRKGDLE